jgi:hypothetical protein
MLIESAEGKSSMSVMPSASGVMASELSSSIVRATAPGTTGGSFTGVTAMSMVAVRVSASSLTLTTVLSAPA